MINRSQVIESIYRTSKEVSLDIIKSYFPFYTPLCDSNIAQQTILNLADDTTLILYDLLLQVIIHNKVCSEECYIEVEISNKFSTEPLLVKAGLNNNDHKLRFSHIAFNFSSTTRSIKNIEIINSIKTFLQESIKTDTNIFWSKFMDLFIPTICNLGYYSNIKNRESKENFDIGSLLYIEDKNLQTTGYVIGSCYPFYTTKKERFCGILSYLGNCAHLIHYYIRADNGQLIDKDNVNNIYYKNIYISKGHKDCSPWLIHLLTLNPKLTTCKKLQEVLSESYKNITI